MNMAEAQTADTAGAADDAASASPDDGDLLEAGQGTEPGADDGDDAGAAAGGEQAGGEEQSDVPDEYAAFSTPEGIEIDENLVAQANPIFKELGLSQEQAQKLVDFQSAQVKAQVDAFHERVNGWKEASRSDPEIGGDKLDSNVAIANKVLFDAFSQPFVDELKQIGFLNHPEFIRGLSKLGNQFYTEDDPGGGNAAGREKSRIERLYGKTE